tara:strand:+ start:509 stop:1156 length:648 start_codon:yes stop_codon:yes gene_type:complete
MKLFLSLIISILYFTNVYSDSLEIFKFNDKELDTLKVRKIRGAKNLTNYSLGNNDKGNFMKAEVEDGGSGLGKEVSVDLNKTPFLNITWKVEKDLSGINEKSKKGHDFAARFFVVKKTGLTPLSNKAINYVFSSNQEIGDYWTSPYTKSSIDYVLSSTKNNLNEWITVKTNVKADYKKLHNLDVDILDGVAIMADSDQSKKQSISYFQNIYFSTN